MQIVVLGLGGLGGWAVIWVIKVVRMVGAVSQSGWGLQSSQLVGGSVTEWLEWLEWLGRSCGQVVRWSGGQRGREAPLVRVIGVDSPRYLQSPFLRHVDSNP